MGGFLRIGFGGRRNNLYAWVVGLAVAGLGVSWVPKYLGLGGERGPRGFYYRAGLGVIRL